MRGVICAGGEGTRLRPLTTVTNKHLLPVYDRPMVYHPLQTLKSSGIDDIMLVTGREHAGAFMKVLGSGEELDVRITYRIQERSGGIAEAISLTEDFCRGESIAVILGDNIYERVPDTTNFTTGARLYLTPRDPEELKRFGVATTSGGRITRIEEKPLQPQGDMVVTGFYVYDSTVFDRIRTCKPSRRNELEITDVNNSYVADGSCSYVVIGGEWPTD
jgi:glucose-1-phosphate thymidylyltransferase